MQDPLHRARTMLMWHLGFIHNSCELYDRGSGAEALRIAVSLRVIFHDGRTNQGTRSLLTQLDAWDCRLLSTAGRFAGQEPDLFFDGLLLQGISQGRRFLRPKLSDGSSNAEIPAREWWGQLVAVNAGHRYTRQIVIRSAADQDMAHVDTTRSRDYEALVDGIFKLVAPALAEPIHAPSQHLMQLRQLGHEILSSPDLHRRCSP